MLFLNSAHCLLKKQMYTDAIKMAKEARTYVKDNPKACYRMAIAYRELNDFDRAKESLLEAIKFAPQDVHMREEYK